MKALRDSLAVLADRVPTYYLAIRDAGFRCCHVRHDWIESHCVASDIDLHRRYLIEYAREAFSTDKPSEILFSDAQNCRSPWLNSLKNERRTRHGASDELFKMAETRHLIELSPCFREQSRIAESRAPHDQTQSADWIATFSNRQSEELNTHNELLKQCIERLPRTRDEPSLQAFISGQVAMAFDGLGAHMALAMRRNQVLQRDDRITAVVFDIAEDCLFVLLPLVTAPQLAKAFSGTLSIGFRLMTKNALAAPNFQFDRDTVVHLQELLPNKFNGYGRFDKPEEFCLNILAWMAALRILLPEVLQTLREQNDYQCSF